MNDQLKNFAREQLKDGLKQLPENWQMTFRRMYSHKDLEKDICAVVDDIPEEKLDWAMQQVENSLKKLAV